MPLSDSARIRALTYRVALRTWLASGLHAGDAAGSPKRCTDNELVAAPPGGLEKFSCETTRIRNRWRCVYRSDRSHQVSQ
ncbi:hypothetical protein LZ31DRAFT_556790 [Colletotrichum somersetense]|nr:hypothetical protein LZ31DRAFT_556790 [Colletotrichum somersetense]